MAANQENWNAIGNVNQGLMRAETVAEHFDEVLEALTEVQHSLLISKEGKVAAIIAPITMDGVLELIETHFPALRELRENAEQWPQGETPPLSEFRT